MELNGAGILDTYAEAFPVWIARVVITAASREWAYRAAVEATGFATSRIGCPCEAGIEGYLSAGETPDGREGVSILHLFREEEPEGECRIAGRPVHPPFTHGLGV